MPWRALTLTTTQGQIAGYNPRRRSLSVANNGAAGIFISGDPTAVSTQGFPVPAGGVATLIREDGDRPQDTLYGVASGGSQDVRIQEGIED